MNIRSVTCCDVFGVKYFEVSIEGIGIVEVLLDDMRRLGVTKTLNGTKKLREWLQTDAGKEYIEKKLKLQ
jgi:hypothetical protein